VSSLSDRPASGSAGAVEPNNSDADAASAPGSGRAGPEKGEPGWARRMRRGQAIKEGAMLSAHALRSGDGGGGGSQVSVKEDE